MEITTPVVTPSPAANGPEDDLLDWHGIDWATCEENVRRLNVALHGLEQAAGCQYLVRRAGREPGAMPGTPVLVRYADDFVMLCHDEEQVHQVRARLEDWRGPVAKVLVTATC